jgi:hypothetical protein
MQLSDKPREKISCKFSPIFFFFIKKNAIWKNHHMQGKIKPDDANTEKQSLDLLFLSSPINTCKDLQKNIGGKTKNHWFLDCK